MLRRCMAVCLVVHRMLHDKMMLLFICEYSADNNVFQLAVAFMLKD